MKADTSISRVEIFIIFTYTSISLTPIGISAVMIRSYKQNAWIIVMLAFLVGLLNLFITLRLAERFPQNNIAEWAANYLGKWGAKIYGVLAISVLFFWSILMFWEHWHLTTYAQLHLTPQFLPAIIEMIAIIYLLTRGLGSWPNVFTVFAPWAFIGLITINLPQFFNSDFSRLRPLFVVESGWEDWRVFILAMFIFRANILLYYFYPNIKQANLLFRPSLLGLAIACIEIILSVVLPIAILGPNSASRLTYPYQESLETIHLSGVPLSKLSFASPLLWLIMMIYVLASSIYCAMKGVKGLIPKANENITISVLAMLAMIVLLFPISDLLLNHLAFYWSMLGLLVYSVIPLIFLIIPLKKGL
ncbi:hypothetical protein EHS13_35795 [Paenibacillus psychroresistens]|uniref:Uncharacterized protein n=1 Tax=Paenibacillus psychroresistens TaxID=1778678 RepID=A0A6B8RVF6_9BACL|nr:GerAB/ArcD/ProY family transporter [Paenibacillus psychroresistens]QGQ99852.1 hypothetical protein EHS13_35795 [Paenibacillus psychroresistens]